jgi:serine/threonine protein kinase
MASVWQATDEVLERQVAAKILHSHLAMDQTFRERFRNEALAAAALTHPNIVAVYDTGDHEGIPFIVMELLPGGTLRDLMEIGSIDPNRVAEIGAHVARALEYAHTHGVIHRDIKPANILFSERGHLKVSDFGIAKAAFAKADLTTTGAVLGTIRYLAPEQVEGDEPDGRADLYSLGLVLYEAATGRQPFTGETDLAIAMARLKATPPPPRDLRPEVPRELNRIILKALAPTRDNRYPDASAMARDLENLNDGVESAFIEEPPQTESIQLDAPSFVKSEGRLILTIILVLLIGGGAVFGLLRMRDSGTTFQDLFDRIASPEEAGSNEPGIGFTAGIYDPPPGNGRENNDEIQRAHDRNPSTSWYTECYARENMGNLKDGVGLFADLGAPAPVKEIQVVSLADGWNAAIRTSENGRQWSEPGSSRTVSSRDFSFELEGNEHRYVQIWITRLVRMEERCARSDEGDWAVGIAELTIR